jgi:hypothetical protein
METTGRNTFLATVFLWAAESGTSRCLESSHVFLSEGCAPNPVGFFEFDLSRQPCTHIGWAKDSSGNIGPLQNCCCNTIFAPRLAHAAPASVAPSSLCIYIYIYIYIFSLYLFLSSTPALLSSFRPLGAQFCQKKPSCHAWYFFIRWKYCWLNSG